MELPSWATPFAAGLSAALVTAHLALWLLPDAVVADLSLIPGHTITRPWQVLTAPYFEASPPHVLLAVPVLLYSGQRLQRAWGDAELARFVLLANLLLACASWAAMVVLYVIFREEHFLFARLGGVTGMLAALSVALKQQAMQPTLVTISPDAPASATSALAFACAHAPTLCLAWSVLSLLITHSGPPDELLFAWNGLLFGWAYLRYYQPRQDGHAGDRSSAFAFALLFPSPLQRPLAVLGATCFAIVSSCGCFPPAGWEPQAGNGSSAPVLQPELPETLDLLPPPPPPAVTTSDPEVAERRRQRARALVEARLAASSAARPAAAPSAA